MPSQLIALVRDMTSASLPPELSVWSAGAWSAIVTSHNPRLRQRFGRRAALRAAATRQVWLEALLPLGTVLPALTGTKLAEADLPALLNANVEQLEAQAQILSGQMQYQITIRCDRVHAHEAICHPALRGATSENWSTRFADLVCARLAEVQGTSLLALPVRDDVVVNVALLLPATAETALETALAEVDALWSEGLNIRQIGPSPAVSFASFGLHPIKTVDVANAARLLGLPSTADPEQIRQARQTALRSPNAQVDLIRGAAILLLQASALPAPGPFQQVHFWSEGRAQKPHTQANVA